MQDPELYQALQEKWSKRKYQFVFDLNSLIPFKPYGSFSILDFGCGTGDVSHNCLLPLLEDYPNGRILATDISEEMISFAKEKFSHEKISFKFCDLMKEDLSMEGFHRIYALNVLMWVKDCRQLCEKLYHLLETGGYLAFTIPAHDVQNNVLEALGKSKEWGKYMQDYQLYLPVWYEKGEDCQGYYAEVLGSTGFTEVKLYEEKFHSETTMNIFSDFYMSLNPFIKNIRAEEVPALKTWYNIYFSDFFNIHEDPDKLISMPRRMLVGVFMKSA